MRSFSKISAIENMADKTFRPMLTYADECHHAASDTIANILKEAKARYVYGVTATPRRADRPGENQLYADRPDQIQLHGKGKRRKHRELIILYIRDLPRHFAERCH